MVLVVVGQKPGARLKSYVAAEAFEWLVLEIVNLMDSLNMAGEVIRVRKGLLAKTAARTSQPFAGIFKRWTGQTMSWSLDKLCFTSSFQLVTFDLDCIATVFGEFNLQERRA